MVTGGLTRDRIASPQPTQFSDPIPSEFHLSLPWTLEVFIYLDLTSLRRYVLVVNRSDECTAQAETVSAPVRDDCKAFHVANDVFCRNVVS